MAHSARITERVLEGREEPVDPGNLPPSVVVWETNAHAGHMPAHRYASRLLATTVEHLNVAAGHSQQRLVPLAVERISVALEQTGLSPATVTKLTEEISRELHVLVAEVNADARKVLHRRMAADLAATLIPRLDGGAS